jgi:restriction endonuclease S subunit
MKCEKVKVNDICNLVRGSSPRPQGDIRFYGGPVPRLMIEDITRDGMYVTPKTDSLTELGGTMSRPMTKGDLVLTVSGRTGVPAILNIDACIHDGFVGFRNLSSKVNVEYLYYYLSFLTEKTNAKSVGAIFKNLTTEQVKNIEVPLPPLHIQEQIADTLDKADALRKKDQELLKKYDELAQSIFYDMFGDPETNPKGFAITTLGDLVCNKSDLVDGPFGSSINVKTDYVKDGEIPVVRTKNVGLLEFNEDDLMYMTREKYETVKRSQVLPGDVIITKVGTIGNISFFPNHLNEGVLSTTGSCRFRPNPEIINPTYLLYNLFYQRPFMKRIAAEGVQPFLNMSHIKSIPLLAPNMSLQKQFEEIINKLWMSVSLTKSSWYHSKSVFDTVSNSYFS